MPKTIQDFPAPAAITPELQKVIARVQKLLALSSNNPSVEEAHAAASQAARIMQEHRIDQAMLESVGQLISEPFIRKVVAQGGRRTAWREILLHGLCDHFGCAFYFSSSRVGGYRAAGAPGSKGRQSYTVVGRKSDTDIVGYMFSWATSEIERLCRWHAGGKGVKFASAWLVGCASGLKSQFDAMKEASRAQAAAASCNALAILDKRGAQAQAWLDANEKLTVGAKVGEVSDWNALNEGFIVGKGIQIKQGLNAGGNTSGGSLGT